MQDKIFEAFSEKFFNTILEINPHQGTSHGLHEYDGRVKDVSAAGIKHEIETLKSFSAELSAINPNELSSKNKYEYNIAKWALESELFDAEEIQPHKNSPRYYMNVLSSVDEYIKRDYAPFDDRLKSLICIVDGIPEVLKSAEENLGESIPSVFCRYSEKSAVSYEDFFQNKLLKEIKSKTSNEKLVSEYISKSKVAVEAIRKFREYLKRVSSETDESYRLGETKFMKMLEVKEHIKVPVDELKKMGTDELARLHDELNKLIAENNFEGKLETLEHDHPTEENLLSDTNAMLNELVTFIREKNIVDLPDKLNCLVVEMPKYDSFGFAAMGTAGPFEKSDESYYYVNLPDADWDEKKKEEWLTQFNYPTLKLISIHEAYPGHYTHFLNANKHSTKLSKLFMSYSYVEGWAHYSEEMMIEQGYSSEDFKSKIGMYIEALIRCCRYLVAIEVHCGKMTFDEATQFFIKNAMMANVTASQEAERSAFDPGYLNYTLGKIYLKRFRDKYFEKFKTEKTLKDFHNNVVALGAPTFRIAEDLVLG